MQYEGRLSETARAAKASDIRELLKLTARPDMISFAGGLPDPSLFPVETYRAAADRVLEQAGAQALQYSETEGLHALREELVSRLRGEGIVCPAGIDNVILTTGSQQALDLIGRLLIDPGDTVIVEAPSYLGALQAFNARKPQYAMVDMDADGMRIDLLEETLANLRREGRTPKYLYTIPNFQNPAGATLSLERRKALLEIAEREDLLIIEDDPYGRLRFRGEHLPSLKQLDRNERVITLRTFSKTLSPGLRTGYVVGAATLLRKLVILKQAADLCSPVLAHYIILDMLAGGALETYVQRVTAAYREKAALMAAALHQHLGKSGVRWNEPEGGMFFWVQLPEGMDSGELLLRSIDAGVAYVKGTAFYPEGRGGQNAMRLNFSQPTCEQVETGIARLAAVIAAQMQVPA